MDEFGAPVKQDVHQPEPRDIGGDIEPHPMGGGYLGTPDSGGYPVPPEAGGYPARPETGGYPDAGAGVYLDGSAPAAQASESTPVPVRLRAWGDELLAWCKTLASAAVYATFIVTFVGQVARVEGTSMAPTLADQDRLVVNKLIYYFSSPRQGDVVMLYYPEDPDKVFVKRVVGEPGDVIQSINGQVLVNGVPLLDDFVPPEFRSHDDFGPSTVPTGYYFVMGDHRNNSSDSRDWGPVPKRYILGKVQLRWWPLSHADVF